MVFTFENAIEVSDLQSTTRVVSRERLINQFAKITQFITWPILFLLFNIFFKIKISNVEIFRKVKSPFIIIANHTAFYDSFLFRLILGFSTSHLPLRFMAVTKFESKVLNFFHSLGIIDFIYSLFGVFTVTPGLGMQRNTKKAKEIIGIGGNLVIYPEGKIESSGDIAEFKNGAAVIYKNTLAKIVPVSFHPIGRSWFRSTIYVNVGDIIDISKGRSVEDLTKIFHNIIKDLYEKI